MNSDRDMFGNKYHVTDSEPLFGLVFDPAFRPLLSWRVSLMCEWAACAYQSQTREWNLG